MHSEVAHDTDLVHTKMKAIQIKHYPNELRIEADNGENYMLNYEGMQGELTRSEWRENEIVEAFDKESQDEILQALDMTYNGDFFVKTAMLRNLVNGMEVKVHATTDHPTSSYGIPVWVDDENIAYCQVGVFPPFYEIIED